ncbi:hypothetical protein RQP53_02405 [Paucibacter sp. APW11]|uniref:Transposase DDE domain-containing protein n=1 Tax=Roseateles aquae TaxID=3077235 RepID=A0ABU3P6C4_9BURK|nr:hypothetical protein [Paucibacter sp. APW11]MDT8998121.1 hypothetical protein [Paucibacter sp. APW11]
MNTLLMPALPCRLQGAVADKTRQSLQIGFTAKLQLKAVFIRQHVLGELRVELCQTLGQCRIATAIVPFKQCAGADEIQPCSLQHAQTLRAQRQRGAPLIQAFDSREQGPVHENRIAVRGQRHCHCALHSLQFRGVYRCRQRVEELFNSHQQASASIEGGDGVVKVWLGRLTGNCPQLIGMGAQCQRKRRLEMFGMNALKRRQALTVGPVLQQRIGQANGPMLRCHLIPCARMSVAQCRACQALT